MVKETAIINSKCPQKDSVPNDSRSSEKARQLLQRTVEYAYPETLIENT
jgi:hypothetical protein